MKQILKQKIAEELLGTCISESEIVKKYNLSIFDTVYEITLLANEMGVWRCKYCGWWVDEVVCQECGYV